MLPRRVRVAVFFLGVSAIAVSTGSSPKSEAAQGGRGCANSTTSHGPSSSTTCPRWPAQRHLRPWRAPPRRRSVRLPRRSAQLWPRMWRRVSPRRRDRPRRALQGHDPRSIVPRRRSDRR